MPKCYRFEQMRPAHLAQALKENPLAYVLISPMEWHGDAMSFGCDPAIGYHIMERVWKKTGGVLVPPIYLGAETLFRTFVDHGKPLYDYWGMENISKQHHPGSLYTTPLTVELVLRDMLFMLEREGFQACALFSGHGGSEHVQVIERMRERYSARSLQVVTRSCVKAKRPATLQFKGTGPHADFAEFSILGAVDRSLVDEKAFGKAPRDRACAILSENRSRIDYAKGKRILDHSVNAWARHLNAVMRELKRHPRRKPDPVLMQNC